MTGATHQIIIRDVPLIRDEPVATLYSMGLDSSLIIIGTLDVEQSIRSGTLLVPAVNR